MALADKMPDLNNMSEAEMEAWAASLTPDELMEFMELLAVRAGATEGLTRDLGGLEIGHIDEDKVTDAGPGYVPYGEEGKAKAEPSKAEQAKAEQAKAEKAKAEEARAEQARAEQARAEQARAEQARAEQARAEQARAEQARAERARAEQARAEQARAEQARAEQARAEQARAEQARAERARAERARAEQARAEQARAEQARAERARAAQAKATQPPPPWDEPASKSRPAVAPQPPKPPVAPPTQSAPPQAQKPLPAPPPPPDEQAISLAWLESLASDQGDDLFNMDLTGGAVVNDSDPRAIENPMNWLESLARTGDLPTPAPQQALERFPAEDDLGSEKIDPFADQADPAQWLDSLARRGGADVDELPSFGGLNIPPAALDDVEPMSYEPYSYEAAGGPARPIERREDSTSAVDFLASLAQEQGYTDGDTDPLDDIQSALAAGTVTPDQMQMFLQIQAEHMLENPADPLPDEADDSDALMPEIPDWLKEMQPQANDPAPAAAPKQPLESLFDAIPTLPESEAPSMPEWLRPTDEPADVDLQSIFDEPEAAPMFEAIQVDRNDPWVEAFDSEHEDGVQAIENVPDWYMRNTTDPNRIAAVDLRVGGADDGELADVPLPNESSLPVGMEQMMPVWAGTPVVFAATAPAAPPVVPDVPEWLRDLDVQPADLQDVPPWLIGIEDEPVEVVEAPFVPPTPAPAPAQPRPVISPPRAGTPAAPPPVPAPQRAAIDDVEAGERLQSARDLEQSGDLEGCLIEYEDLIRANVGLDVVVQDLTQMARSYRNVPSVFRLLGDGLMRQGKLQEALNTYREALNQL